LGLVGHGGSSAPTQLVGGNVDLVGPVGDANGLAGLQGRADEPAGEGSRLKAGCALGRAVQAVEDEAGQLHALDVPPDVGFLKAGERNGVQGRIIES